jgi:hypothetical protein
MKSRTGQEKYIQKVNTASCQQDYIKLQKQTATDKPVGKDWRN